MSVHVLHVASFFAIVSSLVLLSVFFAPWWLVNDGHHPNETFQRLGLWTACFKDANVSHTESSTQCSWIFNEDDLSNHNITIPAFFTVTQTLFTLCVAFLILISLPALTRFFYVHEGARSKINLLFVISGCLSFSALCGTAAIIVFGAYSTEQQWVPNIEHKNIGTAYYTAVICIFFEWIASLLVYLKFLEERGKNRNDHFTLIDATDFSVYTL